MGSSAESGGAKQLKWISNESAGKCIDLQSIVPNRVPITSTGKVSWRTLEWRKEREWRTP